MELSSLVLNANILRTLFSANSESFKSILQVKLSILSLDTNKLNIYVIAYGQNKEIQHVKPFRKCIFNKISFYQCISQTDCKFSFMVMEMRLTDLHPCYGQNSFMCHKYTLDTKSPFILSFLWGSDVLVA